MAEGLLRTMTDGRVQASSAGTQSTIVRPLAIEAMAEVGIDISGHHSKTLDEFLRQPFDAVVTVCDDAKEACPLFPGAARQIHWSLPDPSQATGSREVQLAAFRGVRDTLRRRISDDLLPLFG